MSSYSVHPMGSAFTASNLDEKIFFVAILRNDETLVKFSQLSGNYDDILNQVFDKFKAFQFLERIKEKFESQYQKRVFTALPFAFQAEFLPTLAADTKRYSENLAFEKLNEVERGVSETKQILSQNIDKLTDRGEKLHLLVDKTDHLCETSISFKTTSRDLARKFFFKKLKMILFFIILALVAIYFIVSISCGGFTWPKCIQH